MLSHHDLVEALQAGEPLAFDQFYRSYAKSVLGWAIRIGGPYVDHEDIAQEVFTVALRKIGSFRSDSSLSTWLYGITRNLIYNARRRAKIRRWVGLSTVAEPVDVADLPDDRVQTLQRRRMVQGVLEQLSDKSREVLVLCDLEGRSAPQAGKMLGIPSGTVYSRLHYARREFAAVMRSDGLATADLFDSMTRLASGAR